MSLKTFYLKIKFISFDNVKIQFIIDRFKELVLKNNLKKNSKNLIKIIHLPKTIRYYCILRSPHVNKCSREHFKVCTYKSFILIDIKFLKFFNSINIPSGVFLTIKKKNIS